MKYHNASANVKRIWSPPSRGAWIEMSATCWKTPIIAPVAPLAGGVD